MRRKTRTTCPSRALTTQLHLQRSCGVPRFRLSSCAAAAASTSLPTACRSRSLPGAQASNQGDDVARPSGGSSLEHSVRVTRRTEPGSLRLGGADHRLLNYRGARRAMDAWQGPVTGWQALMGAWVSLAAFALLLLAAVTLNVLADTHPTLGRWRDAAARTVDRAAVRLWAAAARLWAFSAPRAEALLRRTVEVTDRSLVAVRRVIDEQRSARQRPAAPEATADRTNPAPATS
jgi:hypothetical protein